MKKKLMIAVCLLCASCGGGYSSSGSSYSPISTYAVEVDCSTTLPDKTVVIQSGSFSPANVSITKNGVVEWTNNDTVAHTTTSGSSGSPNGYFDLTVLSSASKCLRFTTTGTFPYFSRTNTAMVGKVMVQ